AVVAGRGRRRKEKWRRDRDGEGARRVGEARRGKSKMSGQPIANNGSLKFGCATTAVRSRFTPVERNERNCAKTIASKSCIAQTNILQPFGTPRFSDNRAYVNSASQLGLTRGGGRAASEKRAEMRPRTLRRTFQSVSHVLV